MTHRIAQFVDRRGQALLALCGVLSLLTGCGSNVGGNVAVSGNVTYDGEPLKTGQVVFEPRGPGRMAIGQLVDGRYSIAAERGPLPGGYVVRITASRPSGETASAGPTGGNELREVYEQFVPAKYNDGSELSIDIESQPSVTHDFDLHST
jgi:hypothetical protein